MNQTINNLTDTLSDNLYEKTRAQLNTFLDETNALLAAGDALNEDRTALARERLAAFLKGSAEAAVHVEGQPPVTRVLNDARHYVKANPWIALGAAAGVGLLVSLLLKRNHP
ncbi:hypothetical protein ABDX87_26880 [Pseudomonas abietaniphila]|jgi:ElaB/YqjD/DUF883 family membrane-anchored ribosome-binding protein|uniref:glycine zipper domain-containing protein n=1 Tax=Pseudomonas abietaniphila TaxID=89065 RepID=UPI003217E210